MALRLAPRSALRTAPELLLFCCCSCASCRSPASTVPLTLPQLVPGVTYLELMEHVRQLYPAAGPFVLKFVDK